MNLSTGEWRQVKRIFEALLVVSKHRLPAALDSLSKPLPHLKRVVQTMFEIHHAADDQTIIPQSTASKGGSEQQSQVKQFLEDC